MTNKNRDFHPLPKTESKTKVKSPFILLLLPRLLLHCLCNNLRNQNFNPPCNLCWISNSLDAIVELVEGFCFSFSWTLLSCHTSNSKSAFLVTRSRDIPSCCLYCVCFWIRMGAPKQKWTSQEETALKAGVLKHGTGKWRTILSDPEFTSILKSRSNVDLKVTITIYIYI